MQSPSAIESETFWKVVRTDLGGYHSCCKNDDMDGWAVPIRVQYVLDKWIQPHIEGSKLFVFNSKEKANEFVNSTFSYYEDIKVLPCRVKNPTKPTRKIMGIHDILYFWKNPEENGWTDLPEGTIWCDEVMVLNADGLNGLCEAHG